MSGAVSDPTRGAGDYVTHVTRDQLWEAIADASDGRRPVTAAEANLVYQSLRANCPSYGELAESLAAAQAQLAAVRALADRWAAATELGTGRPSIVMRAMAEEVRAALAADAGEGRG